MKLVKCNFCGSDKYKELYPNSDNYYLQHSLHRVVQCLDCGLIFTNPQAEESDIDSIYPKQYYGNKNVRFNFLIEAIVRYFRRKRAKAIIKFKEKGKILDIGCGRGYFLERMERLGWDAYGTEISHVAADRAKSKFGERITLGDLLDTKLAAGSFDCISIYHVLEHTTNPREIIKEIHTLLKPNGLLQLAIPNIDCMSFRMLKSR